MRLIRILLKTWLKRKQEKVLKRFSSCGKHVTFANRYFLINPQYIVIGDGSSFSDGLVLTAWDKYNYHQSDLKNHPLQGRQNFLPSIRFGTNCNIGRDNHISAIGKIEIGDNLLTGMDVTISDNSHGFGTSEDIDVPPSSRPLSSKGPIH